MKLIHPIAPSIIGVLMKCDGFSGCGSKFVIENDSDLEKYSSRTLERPWEVSIRCPHCSLWKKLTPAQSS